MSYSKDFDDYLVKELINNCKQLSPGDMVLVTHPGWTSLQRSQRFWTSVAIGSALGVVTFGAATGFVGLGSGAFGGLAIGAEAIAAAGFGTGAAVGGATDGLINLLRQASIPADQMLQALNMVGRVLRIDTKIFSEEHHIEVEFYIPNGQGGYTERTEWIDAHHLMKAITKEHSRKLFDKAKAAQEEAERRHEAELLKRHRRMFAPENAELLDRVNQLNYTVTDLKAIARTWRKYAITFAVFGYVLGQVFPLGSLLKETQQNPQRSESSLIRSQ